MSSRVLSIFKDADSKTSPGTFSSVSEICEGFFSPFFPYYVSGFSLVFTWVCCLLCCLCTYPWRVFPCIVQLVQQDLPWASSFPGWTFPAVSASPHTSSASAPLTTLVAFPGLTPVCPCLLCWGGPAAAEHSRCGLSDVRWKGSLPSATPAAPAQDAVGLLCHKGALLTHVQLDVHRHTNVLFCRAAF